MEIYQIEIQAEANQATAQWATFLSLEPIKERHHKNPTFYNHMNSVLSPKGETLIRRLEYRRTTPLSKWSQKLNQVTHSP